MSTDPSNAPPSAAAAEPRVRIAFVREGARDIYASDTFLAPATALSAGLDLRACLEAQTASIAPGDRLVVPTGIAVQPLDPLVAGFVYSRSGLGARQGVTVAQGVGVIDPDYTGEITVILLNTARSPQQIARGDRIAQLVFQPIVRPRWIQVAQLAATDRGGGGFGHTGR
jgi:dUTP pyrophosphatase